MFVTFVAVPTETAAPDRADYLRQYRAAKRAENPDEYRKRASQRMACWRAKNPKETVRSRARHGAPEAFLLAYIAYNGDDCVIWPFGKNSGGYGSMKFGDAVRPASRVMCTLTHGEPPSLIHEAAHSCGNRPCINPNHLRWATPVENISDCKIHGTVNWGERNGKTKRTNLTDEDIRAIRADSRLQRLIAAEYGISPAGISKIRSGQRWGHIS
jgi:hypothetical protein